MPDKSIIVLKKIIHRQQERIAVEFKYSLKVQANIKSLPGIRWSQTHQCWHLPFSKGAYDLFVQKVKDIAIIDDRLLRIKKHAGESMQSVPYKKFYVSSDNLVALQQMEILLRLKAYSSSTIRTYCNELLPLLQLLKERKINDLSVDDIKRYLLYCITVLKLKENSIHSRLNALKFYFEQVLGREKFFVNIPRPKRPLLLPKVLSETELGKLFASLKNKKHKAMLFTAYSAGLRVSEVACLKLKDIDSGRMQILISKAKGKKDRYVNLSPILLDILRDYIKTSKPRPKEYLFESDQTGGAYPTRTIQQIFRNAREAAGIEKEVGIHSLRHSFATHLLEKGTDIRYIKDILGHFNIKTTEIYLHVNRQQFVNINSPLDELYRKGLVDW